MADKTIQLEACKAAASKYQSQLQTAATKDEALTLAISVAENLMKALKLSSQPDERKELQAQCRVVMDVADRIKTSNTWTPLQSPPQPDQTKRQEIGQWAAEVGQYVESAAVSDEGVSQSSKSVLEPSSSTTPAGNPYSDGSELIVKDIVNNAKPLPVTGEDAIKLSALRTDGLAHKMYDGASSAAVPSTSPYSKVRRLPEPISKRKRAKKEEIILLKASVVNGFKCPPWDTAPSSAEFAPIQGTKLFIDTHDLSLSPYQQQFFQGWARAKEAVPPPSMFPNGRIGAGPVMSTSHSIDLVQDAATDCSVVASLCAAVARAERGHDQILSNKINPFDKNLGTPVVSSNGKYVVRLNFNGCWRKVVIDDRLPLSKSHRLLHVIDRRQPALLWPALLEKAYLKVRGGYDFPGSNSCSDLWTMTGWIPEQVHLQETDTVPGQLWHRIYKAFRYGDVLVTLGTGNISSRQERELGLTGQHSYVVLDMKETEHDRLLLVKNPWVEGKGWRGPRPETAPVLDTPAAIGDTTNSIGAFNRDNMPSKDQPHPSTFWIGLEQVIRHFESLYLNWNPGLFCHRQDIHFEWKIEGSEGDSLCIVNHPQFSFWSEDAEPVWFLLTRHFRDSPGETKDDSDAFNDGSILQDTQMNSSGEASKGYMSIYVCNGRGERLYIKDTCLESSDYVTTPQCLLRFDADANSTYTVVVDQDELPASSYTFSLSAFSVSEMALEPATQKYPFQRVTKGEWTRQTAGGSTSSSRYFENPQYMLEVKEKGPLAILLMSTIHKNPLHVKLTLGYGKRMYRLQSRDVLVDSGDHQARCVFAEIQDLQPGLYTIICSLFEAGQTGDYTLRVDSTSDIVLKQIPRDGAGLILTKLAPACFGPQMQKVAAPILPHRLASYTIVVRFMKVTSPRSMGVQNLARSPLRFSVEVGRGPERQFVIASERGEYADSATVRSEATNIDPSDFRHGNLWLVLDRLSGPGGPVEEWYEVELFTDVPQACTVGVWRDWND